MAGAIKKSQPWVKEVASLLDHSHQRVFNKKELGELLATAKYKGTTPASLTLTEFIERLSADSKLREVRLTPHREVKPSLFGSSGVTRYAWGDPSPYSLALSFRSGSYLSHASAMFLHGLSEQIPKTIYVNAEQSEKPSGGNGTLTQEAIDRAFARPPRISKYVFAWEGFRFVRLSGKYTGRLEVSQIKGPVGEILDVTKVERTLIDIAVRPMYAGGVYEVAKAFETARDRTSINTVLATLKKLDYIYPYHQIIGFYLQRAGCNQRNLEKLRSLGLEFDFYLTYQIPRKKYDPTWRLYYPEGL